MKIQLALDRMTIMEAISVASVVSPYVDWIEVGTSLVKEHGMASVRALREAFPSHMIVADMKTIDNAKYEMEMCFRAGANVATVMGAAPIATIECCKQVADACGGHLMVDLLATDAAKRQLFSQIQDVTWCYHVSKDEQELQGHSAAANLLGCVPDRVDTAVAGGVTLDSMERFKKENVDVVIIGSAITKSVDISIAAKQFYEAVHVL